LRAVTGAESAMCHRLCNHHAKFADPKPLL